MARFVTTGEPLLPDGFYGVWFKTPRDEGAGVVTLANGQLRGGDSALAYSGMFAQDGDHFTAIVAADAMRTICRRYLASTQSISA